MPNKSIKAAFTHAEDEGPLIREYGMRISHSPNSTVTVAVKRVAGTSAGKVSIFSADSPDSSSDRSLLGSINWGDESSEVCKAAPLGSSNFLVVTAEFIDSSFGQVEVNITTY